MRSRFTRFSLLSLFLLVSLVSVAVSFVLVTYENRRLRGENDDLKEDLGYISVADPNNVYVRHLETVDELTWRFRIYLPPQKKYMLCFKDSGGGSSNSVPQISDQFTLTCGFRRNAVGEWRFNAVLPDRAYSAGSREEVAEKLTAAFTGKGLRREQEAYSPDSQIELLKFRDDVRVWLEQESQVMAKHK